MPALRLCILRPNSINPLPFENAFQKERGCNELLQLGFLGRLEHKQKGVMHLKKLVEKLNDLEVLSI